MMGIPGADRARVGAWSDCFSAVLDPMLSRHPEQRAAASRVAMEAALYFRQVVAERTQTPRQDLVSVIAAAEEQDRLSEIEVLAGIGVLLVAGYETVKSSIGFGIPGRW